MRADGTSFAYKNAYGQQIDHLIAQMGLLDLPTTQIMHDFIDLDFKGTDDEEYWQKLFNRVDNYVEKVTDFENLEI